MREDDHFLAGTIAADDLVADVLRRAPETATVFVARRMACPGCAMAPFMTVAETAASYNCDPDELVRDLMAAVGRRPG